MKPKTLDAKVKSPEARVAACKAIGGLGELGKPQRRALCVAMLDANPAVQVAAMDAMKLVDSDMHKICVSICIDRDLDAVTQASLLGDASKPIVPLLMSLSTTRVPIGSVKNRLVAYSAEQVKATCVQAVVKIDPADEAVNKAVLAMLANNSPELCTFALSQVPLIESKKLALPSVLDLAANSHDRVAAIRIVPGLVDDATKAGARKSLEAMRYDKLPAVREASAAALKMLE